MLHPGIPEGNSSIACSALVKVLVAGETITAVDQHLQAFPDLFYIFYDYNMDHLDFKNNK